MFDNARYSEALNDGPSEAYQEAIDAKAAEDRLPAKLGAEAAERAKYIADLLAKNNELRRQLDAMSKRAADAESNLHASAAIEQEREERIHALEAELSDARQQHADDVEEMYRLGQEVRRLDILAETHMYERDDAKKVIADLKRRIGVLQLVNKDLSKDQSPMVAQVAAELVTTMSRVRA